MELPEKQILIQQIKNSFLEDLEVELHIKREDLIHPLVSGNKFRKLKYNIAFAQEQQKEGLITFGGAYSNHILATAAAANLSGLKSIGIIRGDELQKLRLEDYNPTLKEAHRLGMLFVFVSRSDYHRKYEQLYLKELQSKYTNYYIVPEGGSNNLAVKGCEEILNKNTRKFTHICCAMGTGGTFSGIVNALEKNQKAIGFPVLKNAAFLKNDIQKWISTDNIHNNYEINHDYHFGGYAKVTEELILMANQFIKTYKIPLDPIYTAKVFFGVLDLIKKRKFTPNSKILLIHTGGIQGVKGFNKQSKNKNLNIYEI